MGTESHDDSHTESFCDLFPSLVSFIELEVATGLHSLQHHLYLQLFYERTASVHCSFRTSIDAGQIVQEGVRNPQETDITILYQREVKRREGDVQSFEFPRNDIKHEHHPLFLVRT